MILQAGQVGVEDVEFLQLLVHLGDHVLDSTLLKDQSVVENFRLALLVVGEVHFQRLNMIGKLLGQLLPVLF